MRNDLRLSDYFNLSEDVRKQIRMVNWDLYYGPFPAGEWDGEPEPLWLGFSRTVDVLKEIELYEVWYDGFDIYDREPDMTEDDEWYYYGVKSVKEEILVTELSPYV